MRFAEPFWEFWLREVDRPQQARDDIARQEQARKMWQKYMGHANRLNHRRLKWKGGRRR